MVQWTAIYDFCLSTVFMVERLPGGRAAFPVITSASLNQLEASHFITYNLTLTS